MILPFLFAFPTLARAGRIPVREALADVRIVAPKRGPRAGSWTLRNLFRRPARLANTLTIVGSDRSYKGVMELKRRVEKFVSASDLQILFVMSQAERTKIIADHLDIVLFTFTLLAFLVLGVSALGQAAASSITVRERTREIGVLRAIGAVPRRITALFVVEGMWTVGTGLILGIILSWPISLVGSAFFGALMIGEVYPRERPSGFPPETPSPMNETQGDN